MLPQNKTIFFIFFLKIYYGKVSLRRIVILPGGHPYLFVRIPGINGELYYQLLSLELDKVLPDL